MASVNSSNVNDTASRQLWTIDAYRIPIEIAIGWQRLAERQCGYLHQMHRSGRWRRLYDEDEFRRLLQEAVDSARQWAAIVERYGSRSQRSHGVTASSDAIRPAPRNVP